MINLSPLQLAAYQRRPAAVTALMDHGAPPNTRDALTVRHRSICVTWV